ncbi:ClpXP protease specificity-enhancing factor [Aliidiomarina soli]|uniref:ClpXP protease specificity-enhancing factor n=1 Tax=Aliidiomarina soli TaxID=1928574 RepID=A0A432WK20_9GAMM|nr:ClpXP protease specificity-enhancing factor [Aliidiomarina soli]RUO34047.1 ClpXP protease specificity-enhancing factor [Aliidiomarina soli]
MSPQRPYLLRAMYDWLVDNQCTPHLIVDATLEFVDVPQEHVQDGQIVLNVHPDAVTRFTMDLNHVSFEARFGGATRRIWVPMTAVTAIYARENGAGTIFEQEPGLDDYQGDPESASEPAAPAKGKPSLKVVK